jgi:hypothetical protein
MPAAFQDILTVNRYPAPFVCIRKIKGCKLQHPLIMSLSELSGILALEDVPPPAAGKTPETPKAHHKNIGIK